jgi:glucosamine kinase
VHEQPLFLGIDGGGTTCRARLCRASGKTIGEGRAGPANVRFGVEESFVSVLEAARQAFAEAGVASDGMRRTVACLALAGASEMKLLTTVQALPHPFAQMIVTTDAHAACVGAHGERDGGIVIVGTGTVGWGRVLGRHCRVGGWGFPVSDEGSGAWLGCEVVRRVLWANDGRLRWTRLLRMIFLEFDSDPHEIVRWMTQATPRDFGRFSYAIAEHATLGDPIAKELMQQAAEYVDALIARLRAAGIARIALAGGLSATIEPWLAAETRRWLVRPEGDALEGALRLARAEASAEALIG